jgi:hypothetical protein
VNIASYGAGRCSANAAYAAPTAARTRRGSAADVRAVCYGVLGLALIAFASAHAVGWFMLVVPLVPLGDTVIVLRHGGTKAAAFGIHFATAVVVFINAALLFAI